MDISDMQNRCKGRGGAGRDSGGGRAGGVREGWDEFYGLTFGDVILGLVQIRVGYGWYMHAPPNALHPSSSAELLRKAEPRWNERWRALTTSYQLAVHQPYPTPPHLNEALGWERRRPAVAVGFFQKAVAAGM